MKKYFYRTATWLSLVAVVAMASCQKEKDNVLFTGTLEQAACEGKTAIVIDNVSRDGLITWESGDQIKVNDCNGNEQTLTAVPRTDEPAIADFTGTATLGGGPYHAVYPENISGGVHDETGKVRIYMDPRQARSNGGHFAAPMYAYSNGSELNFKNLCGVLQLNLPAVNKSISSIVLSTPGRYINGYFEIDYNGGDPTLRACYTNGTTLTVDCGNGLDCSQGLTFYIYLPPNSYPEMTFTINTTDGSYATKHFEDEDDPIVIERNVYYPTTFNSLTFFDYATLVAGSTFRSAIPSDATSVVFEYRSSVTTGTLLSTSDSPLPIYGNLDGTVWRVSTIAAQIEATNCSTMFAGKTSLTNISFGGGFSTSIVTNMGQMFYGCTSLSGLDLSMFNTSNVTNMGNMFAFCGNLTNLNIANFDLGGLTTNDAKSGMFRLVGSMNSSLNITCTWSAKNELLRNRDIYALPNYATFNGGGGGEHQ